MQSPASSEFIPQILQSTAHRRFNPLTGEWVLVSPHRTERPWQGQTEPAQAEPSQAYDPNCYLCPGNVRAGGQRNPPYTGTFVFNNDFAALQPEPSAAKFDLEEKGIVVAQSESGICRVVCFSPRHDLDAFANAADGNPRLDRCLDRGISKFRAATRHQLCADF